MHQNKNFHIRTISVTLAQLLSDKKYFIPHLHAAEGKKDNVKILTKRFFDTYGIRTLNESKT
jgi:hypothetical protein